MNKKKMQDEATEALRREAYWRESAMEHQASPDLKAEYDKRATLAMETYWDCIKKADGQ
ncbi:hypothetical protein AB0B15_14245 [Streptomyces sp. NPDC045456]|uniref:hypothetical protein n=1 Tax=Streptomyces sp. NPDC045456 TaxID=3155254 RepID=UPI0034058220